MTPQFFHDKPISLLLGKEVKAEQLNDDSLGRCLDKIASYGTTKWYSKVALEVVTKAGLLSRVAHIDSTTLSLYGEYPLTDEEVSPKPLFGYSKGHRADLKQVTLQCVLLGRSALPIWMEALDGNSSDKKSFPETVKKVEAMYHQIQTAPRMCFVGDSALYGAQLSELNVDWLTRVPEVCREAKLLCERPDIEWTAMVDDRYKVFEYQPEGKAERWLLVRSEPALSRENETLLRRHQKSFEALEKALWHCCCQRFNCEQDAKKAIEKVIRAKKHFYEVGYEIEKIPHFSGKGRPSKNQLPESFSYQPKVTRLLSDLAGITEKRKTLGRFILATNVLDKEVLSNESMLMDYKEQSGIERGFRFIKNDTFGLDEVYLKKPERIGALMAVMTLCLLVYGLTQYRLREALKNHQEDLPDRKKKPTKTPTLMWIFSLFSSICMVCTHSEKNGITKRVVMNLQPVHEKVILLLGPTAGKMYLLPESLSLSDVKLNQKTWLKWCGI